MKKHKKDTTFIRLETSPFAFCWGDVLCLFCVERKFIIGFLVLVFNFVTQIYLYILSLQTQIIRLHFSRISYGYENSGIHSFLKSIVLGNNNNIAVRSILNTLLDYRLYWKSVSSFCHQYKSDCLSLCSLRFLSFWLIKTLLSHVFH